MKSGASPPLSRRLESDATSVRNGPAWAAGLAPFADALKQPLQASAMDQMPPTAPSWFARHDVLKENLSPLHHAPSYSHHLIPEGQPSGGVPLVGVGAAPAGGVTIHSREALGHRRKPPPAAASFTKSDADCASLSVWGYYGPCARSSLDRSFASRLRPMPDGATTR